MPRRRRTATAGYVQHVLNRAVRKHRIFHTDRDYRAFVTVLLQARRRFAMRTAAFVVMPNHWHLLLWPDRDEQLSQFMHWLTTTHTQRWHTAHRSVGTGPLYQGRYKAIPVQDDGHFYTVARYVERNPVRAGLVERVEKWRWSSAWYRAHYGPTLFDDWPVPLPPHWVDLANEPQGGVHLGLVRDAVRRGRPYGDGKFVLDATLTFGLEHTCFPQGRRGKNRNRLPTP